jgi:Ca2+-binding EF-hand superfamily protein
LFQGITPTPQLVQNLSLKAFNEMDADRDGSITKEEFRNYCLKNKKNEFSFLNNIPKRNLSKTFNPADFKELTNCTNDSRIA